MKTMVPLDASACSLAWRGERDLYSSYPTPSPSSTLFQRLQRKVGLVPHALTRFTRVVIASVLDRFEIPGEPSNQVALTREIHLFVSVPTGK